MARSFNLLEHYPDRWRDLKEIQAICDSDILEADGDGRHTLPYLWDCMDTELNNAFILPYEGSPGMDEYACSRWESMLGIVAAHDATLDDRQFVIYSRMFKYYPYSYRNLQYILDEMIGVGQWSMSRDVGKKELNVVLRLSSRFKIQAMREFLDKIVPANMLLNITIAYTTYEVMEDYTHDELSEYTHDEIPITELRT